MRNLSRARFLAAAFWVVSAAAVALGADLNGKWSAEVPGRDGQTMATTFNFKVDGDALTGTVSSPRGEAPIQDGKVNGDEFSFTQKLEFNGNSFVIKYSGKVEGDQIKMKRVREGGQGRAAEFTAKRAAS